jgi:hydroxymethylpyrimidine pyrophosphatase-like HAD family hydrolase
MIDYSKVKLVVSDMDGTLLNSKGEVSKRFFELFKELQKRKITFCAASGRQHNSIVSKLDAIKDELQKMVASQKKETMYYFLIS